MLRCTSSNVEEVVGTAKSTLPMVDALPANPAVPKSIKGKVIGLILIADTLFTFISTGSTVPSLYKEYSPPLRCITSDSSAFIILLSLI